MDRKQFIKTIGVGGALAGVGAGTKTLVKALNPPEACVLIPSETAGPFPLDLTENNYYFRKNITEDRTGVPLNVKLKVLGLENCAPMANVRVNIWHCDKDGLYSGYDNSQNAGQAGKTYLRGYQITNTEGIAEFTTILPGWYNGRICHIHFQVYVSTSYAAISQLTFDINTKNSIYLSNAGLYTKGADPMTFSSDNIFSDGYQYQLATLTANTTTGGYDTSLEVSVKGSGTTGIGYIEKINAAQFDLSPAQPNPATEHTFLPIHLKNDSHVSIELYDLQGKKITTAFDEALYAGKHKIEINRQSLSIIPQSYVCQLTVTNNNGIFKDHVLIQFIQ